MKTITLNIGQLTSTGRRMSRAEMEAKLRSVIPEKYITFTKVVNKHLPEATLVVQAVTSGERGVGPGNKPMVEDLCSKLQQDCIAFKYDYGARGEYLCGPLRKKYEPFDINKFVTKEQAMSYGHPSNPARFAVGDKVILKDQTQFSGEWAGPMTVTSIHSTILMADHPKKANGGFGLDTVEPYVEPKPLVEQIEEAEVAYDKAQAAVAEAAKVRDDLVVEFRKLRDKELAVKKAENERIVPVEFTAEELGYLLSLVGRLCGDSNINVRIYSKLVPLGLPKSPLFFDMRSAKGSTPGVWTKATLAK
jgi:hypothetical protein